MSSCRQVDLEKLFSTNCYIFDIFLNVEQSFKLGNVLNKFSGKI